MRALLADGEATVRRALRDLLTRDLAMEVVGEVDAASRLRGQVCAHRPDLLVVDWDLVVAPPAATLAALRRACPGLYIIVLSLRPEDRRAALAVGADAFVSKVDPPDQVVHALQAARPRTCSGPRGPIAPRAAQDSRHLG